jgi:hypothetical protein
MHYTYVLSSEKQWLGTWLSRIRDNKLERH